MFHVEKRLMPKLALIVVDMQNDFMDGGALEVKGSKDIVTKINEYMKLFHESSLPIFATRDWHPPNHISFEERGGPWPPHCVQFTEGASFYPGLKFPDQTEVISKATEPDVEAYSGFQGTDLAERLRRKGVEKIFICGVATEYCVMSTALDALKERFNVSVLVDAIKGIREKDVKKAIERMSASGVSFERMDGVREELSRQIANKFM